MTTAALITWALNVLVGLVLLYRSPRRPALVWFHLVTAVTSLALWIGYAVVGLAALAWIAFAVLTVTNVLGDTALTRGWRARNPRERRSGARDYFRAAVEGVSGKRPFAMVHGLLAGVTYFVSLFAALAA